MTIKRYLKENKRQVTTWENIFATSTADQRMLPIMIPQMKRKRTNNPIENNGQKT